MRVLITGGAGFIGRHLCARMAALGHQVTAFDMPPVIAAAGEPPAGVRYQDGSVCAIGPQHVEGFDLVIHAAAVLGVALTQAKPRYMLNVNVGGTLAVVEACERGGVGRLIYLSSSEVYGNADRVPTPESCPLAPLPGYGIAKACGEEYVRTFLRPWTIVRPFNVYGPGQRDDFVLSRWCRRAVMGEKLEVYGGGAQVRSFCYVDDFVEAVARLADHHLRVRSGGEGVVDRRVFNVGDWHRPVSMRDLAELVARLAGRGSAVEVQGDWPDRFPSREVDERVPDCEAMYEHTGWLPEVDLREGLRRLLDWWRERMEGK